MLITAGCSSRLEISPSRQPPEPTSPTLNHYSALDQPARPEDKPDITAEDLDDYGEPMPTEWRWVANTPRGGLYLGLSPNQRICVIVDDRPGGGAVKAVCGTQQKGRVNAGISGDDRSRYGFYIVPDGYTTLRGSSIRCNVKSNAVVILNWPRANEVITFAGPTMTITESVEVHNGLPPVSGNPYCA